MILHTELASMFERMAQIIQLRGENAFKAIAFQKVARVLSETTLDLSEAVRTERLGEIEGIGEHSRRIIEQYVKTHHSDEYDKMTASVPPGVLAMLGVPGLGPKTVAQFWKLKGITSCEELGKAIDAGTLSDLHGIGEKKLAAIRDGLRIHAAGQQRRGLLEASLTAQEILAALLADSRVRQAEIAGSLRRQRETIGDVDILCTLKKDTDGQAIGEAFSTLPMVERVLVSGATKTSVLVKGGLQVDLRVVPEDCFGSALLYFTGSKEHNVKLRGLAQDKGFTLNEWGLYREIDLAEVKRKPGERPAVRPQAGTTEQTVYHALGLPYIVPELREDRGEIEAAVAGRLPTLLTAADIRGDLHNHTTASDGTASIREMAEAALALGYQYLAITDHSASSVIANGLSAQRLLAHVAEIRKVAGQLKGITLLAGAEVDILADGRLDYEDAVLAELDIVVASPHVSLRQPQDKATDRLLRAIAHRYVNVIGHPSGRMINQREGLPLDWVRLYEAAARSGTAMEINSGWPRLDLDDIHARQAAQAGVLLCINTDAHATRGLEDIHLGLGVARRAWLEAKQVLNTFPIEGVRAFLTRKR
jgi:DNA polymerase (family X)